MSKHLTPDQLDAFEERAAILEYDAGLPRQEAETLAARELAQNSPPNGGNEA